MEALRVLIEEGRSKVDARNKEGSTPLLLAAESGCQPAALYLASRGADVEVREVRGAAGIVFLSEEWLTDAGLRCRTP